MYELAPTKDDLVLVVIDRRLRRTGAIAREQVAAADHPGDKIDAYLIRSGIRPTSLRFAPSLLVSEAEIDEALTILEGVLA